MTGTEIIAAVAAAERGAAVTAAAGTVAEEGGSTGAVAATPGETAVAAVVGVTVGDGTGTTGGGTAARTGGETGTASPTDEGTESAALIGRGIEREQVKEIGTTGHCLVAAENPPLETNAGHLKQTPGVVSRRPTNKSRHRRFRRRRLLLRLLRPSGSQ